MSLPRRSPFVLLLCAALGGSAGALRAEEPPRLVTTVLRTVTLDVEGVDGSSLSVAPRSAHVAFRVRGEAGTAWHVDGEAGPAFDEVGAMRFSDDGAHFAYLGRRGAEWHLVRDGAQAPAGVAEVEADSLRFAPDGAHLAFVGVTAPEHGARAACVVLDGKPGPPHADVDAASLLLSRAGAVAYLASEGAEEFAVLDGKPGPRHPKGSVSDLRLSADGKRVGYALRTEGGRAIVVDGKASAAYAWVGPVTFAPVGARWLCGVKKGTKAVVVVDGVEGPEFDDLGAPGPLFSPDGTRTAYAAMRAGSFLVVADGVEGKAYKRIGSESLVFSPDGKRLAYWASDGKKPFFVVDGVEQPPVDLVMTGSAGFAFGPDAQRFAYGARKGGSWVVVTASGDGPATEGIGAGFPVFSPNGEHVCTEARVQGRWVLVVDQAIGEAVDGFAEGPLAFGQDGATPACAARVGSAWHLYAGGRLSPEGFQTLLPGARVAADGPRSFHAWVFRDGAFQDLRIQLR